MEYYAMANIGVPGYGRVAYGEYLDEKCKAALGEEILAELVKDGAVKPVDTTKAEAEAGSQENGDTQEPDAAKENGDAANEPGDEDVEAEELEPDTMDDVVDEAEESEEVTETKPKKNSGGRKAK